MPRSKSGGGTDASRLFESDPEMPRSLRPIAPGNGSASPPPWDLDRSGGLCFFGGWCLHDGPRAYPSFMSKDMPTSASPPGAERILAWIMAALVVWGLFHAAGAWMLNHDARRPLIVIACVAAFLGFWLAMLSARTRRLAREQARHQGR
jgi:hypothetical protein